VCGVGGGAGCVRRCVREIGEGGKRYDMNTQVREQERGGDMKGNGGAKRDLGSDHDHLPVWPGGMRGQGSSRSRSRTLH
jgi:hypothetical protein